MKSPDSTPLQELEALIRAGAARRWPSPLSEAVQARLDAELAWLRAKPEIWHQAFLLACNRFASARELDAAIAPCRGAATGSAIAYALGLTDLDPLAHGLRPEPFFFRVAPTFPLETDTKVAIDVRQWARISYATAVDTAQLLGVDDDPPPSTAPSKTPSTNSAAALTPPAGSAARSTSPPSPSTTPPSSTPSPPATPTASPPSNPFPCATPSARCAPAPSTTSPTSTSSPSPAPASSLMTSCSVAPPPPRRLWRVWRVPPCFC